MLAASDLGNAITRLRMLSYWPADAEGAVMELLLQMCPHSGALDWLVGVLINKIGRWPGPAEVRGLLCTRFRPADGIEGNCSLSGFSPAAMEGRAAAELQSGGAQLQITGDVERMTPAALEEFRREIFEPFTATGKPKAKKPVRELECELVSAMATAPRLTDAERAARAADLEAAVHARRVARF